MPRTTTPALAESPYMRLDHTEATGVVRMTRTRTSYENAAAVLGDLALMRNALVDSNCAQLKLLVDLRPPVGRNDDAFEQMISPLHDFITTGFARVAFVVRTCVGQLQLQRRNTQAKVPVQAFLDESAAWQWLVEEPTHPI